MPRLHPHIGRRAAYRRPLFWLSALGAFLFVGFDGSADTPLISIDVPPPAISPSPQDLFSVLSGSDRRHYRDAFALQRDGDIEEADAALAQVNDPILVGTVYAERYRAPGYRTPYNELAGWLRQYGDDHYPQQADLYRLALARKPQDADLPASPVEMSVLKGFANGHDRSVLRDEKHWLAGLAAYRKKDMRLAAQHF